MELSLFRGTDKIIGCVEIGIPKGLPLEGRGHSGRMSQHGIPEQQRAEVESRWQPGEVVPCSGVYRVRHKEHRDEHDGILLNGQVFPACTICGDQVRFQLLQAANPIEQQPAFEIREAADHSALRCEAAAGAGTGHSAIVFALTPTWKR